MGNQVTVYVNEDEAQVIQKLMEALGLKFHQVLKLAIHSFLFPTEVSKMDLNGAYADITHAPIHLPDRVDDTHRRITITKEGEEKKDTVVRITQ
jgi:hypothetical protein